MESLHILDFGVSKLFESDETKMTVSVQGTDSMMGLEVIKNSAQKTDMIQ